MRAAPPVAGTAPRTVLALPAPVRSEKLARAAEAYGRWTEVRMARGERVDVLA